VLEQRVEKDLVAFLDVRRGGAGDVQEDVGERREVAAAAAGEGEDLQAAGLTTEIPAYGEWSYMSGLPVQDTVWGMGELLRCTDENGNSLTFTGYIPLNAV
jgi:hypothetical protein